MFEESELDAWEQLSGAKGFLNAFSAGWSRSANDSRNALLAQAGADDYACKSPLGIEAIKYGSITTAGMMLDFIPMPAIGFIDDVAKTGSKVFTDIAKNYPIKRVVTKFSKSGGEYLYNNWHKATFENIIQSLMYHLKKHGKGRTATQYTKDAMDFYNSNLDKAVSCILKDGTPGYKIRNGKVGGYYTIQGKVVSYWD